jgi:hypothetical protein
MNLKHLILFTCLLSACNTPKQQIRRLDGLVLQQPSEFARLSNLINPCFTGRAKSDTVVKSDTVKLPGNTNVLITHIRDTVIKTITITLPGRIINHILTIHDTVPDTRALANCTEAAKADREQRIQSDTKLQDSEKIAQVRLYWLIGVITLLIALGIWNVYKMIYRA